MLKAFSHPHPRRGRRGRQINQSDSREDADLRFEK